MTDSKRFRTLMATAGIRKVETNNSVIKISELYRGNTLLAICSVKNTGPSYWFTEIDMTCMNEHQKMIIKTAIFYGFPVQNYQEMCVIGEIPEANDFENNSVEYFNTRGGAFSRIIVMNNIEGKHEIISLAGILHRFAEEQQWLVRDIHLSSNNGHNS